MAHPLGQSLEETLQLSLVMFDPFLGLWLVILVFWQIESVNRQYWDTVFNLMQIVGVDANLAAYGLQRFWFWR